MGDIEHCEHGVHWSRHCEQCVAELEATEPQSWQQTAERLQAEKVALLQQLQGAVSLVRELGSAWRRDDMTAAGDALARLEDAVGLREQGA